MKKDFPLPIIRKIEYVDQTITRINRINRWLQR